MLSRRVSRVGISRSFFALVLLACTAAAPAQDQPLESRLPARTTFYVSWHGSKPLTEARATNSLLRLWEDPDISAAQTAVVTEIFSSVSKGKKDKFPLSRQDVSSLLENPFVIGGLRKPSSAAPPAAKPGQPNIDFDAFVIYERTGKEEILSRLMDLEKSRTPALSITKSTFRYTQIETVVSGEKKDTYYRTASGRYLVACQRRELMEDLITRLGAAGPPLESLAGSAEHRAALGEAKAGDALRFYFSLKGLLTPKSSATASTGPAAANAASMEALFRTLRLDRLESISASVGFEGPTTHFRFAVLGDLSQGGVTDIIGAGAPEFSTLAAVPASAAGFNSMRLDVSAFYRILREGISAMAPAGQPNPADSFETMVAGQIGMTVPEMMKLLSGEFATVELEPSLDLSDKMFLFSIDKPDDVLHLIRALMTDNITNEEQAGQVTYLSFLFPTTPKPAGTPAPSRKFWYIAVGPHLLIVAPRKAMARETMARFQRADHAGSLAADPGFLTARKRLPQNLSGVNYSDLSKVDWTKLTKQIEEYTQTAATQSATNTKDPNQKQEVAKILGDMWKQLPLQSISRYIHTSYGGWWKDKRGVYFDSYVD